MNFTLYLLPLISLFAQECAWCPGIPAAHTFAGAVSAVSSVEALSPDSNGEFSGVSTGLEVLADEDFARLKGLKLGVVTNHTGVDRRGRSIIDLLLGKEDIYLLAVFAPEHGLSGKLEGVFSSSRLEGVKLSVYSLYGETRKPRQQWLDGLDALIFDIQDIGARFYTYIYTIKIWVLRNKIRLRNITSVSYTTIIRLSLGGFCM